MKVILTAEDKDLICKYALMKFNDPCNTKCKGWSDRGTCCGCQEKRVFEANNKILVDQYNYVFGVSSVIREFAQNYVNAYMNYLSVKESYDDIKIKLDKAKDNLKSFEEMCQEE